MNHKVFIVTSIIIILISCIFLLYPSIYFNLEEGFIEPNPETGKFDTQDIMKRAVIPLNIFQTWHTKDLPPKMKECVDKLKHANQEFKHYLYDENECREFIKKNFDSDILRAFDGLIPLSYKSDLWRFCVLYKLGGIYLDIKYEPVEDFKFIELVDKEYFVLERPYIDKNILLDNELELINLPNYHEKIYDNIDTKLWKNKKIGLYTALIVCKPNNQILLECIQEIVKNVKTKYYGHNDLYPSGPGLLGEKYFKGDMSKIENINLYFSLTGLYIINKNKKILKSYDDYYGNEHTKYAKIKHYHELWDERKIYKE
jgi:hypothetical protein